MKLFFPIVLIATFIFSACWAKTASPPFTTNEKVNSTSTATQGAENKMPACKICDFDFKKYKGDLTEPEIEGLLLALNDEYLAWATYDRINKDFKDSRPFTNIQKAEARHIERLKEIFETYQMAFPANKWIGKTERYKGVEEACKAGIEAEVANHELYTKIFDSTKREDILLVYKNLQRASKENHLPAFRRCSKTVNE